MHRWALKKSVSLGMNVLRPPPAGACREPSICVFIFFQEDTHGIRNTAARSGPVLRPSHPISPKGIQ